MRGTEQIDEGAMKRKAAALIRYALERQITLRDFLVFIADMMMVYEPSSESVKGSMVFFALKRGCCRRL